MKPSQESSFKYQTAEHKSVAGGTETVNHRAKRAPKTAVAKDLEWL